LGESSYGLSSFSPTFVSLPLQFSSFLSLFFLFHCSPLPLDLHSFPTRRSSDLFLSEFFSVVQRRAPSFWHRLVDASHGSLWPSGKRLAATPGCARCCLPTSPGALRTKRSQTTGSSQRSMD